MAKKFHENIYNPVHMRREAHKRGAGKSATGTPQFPGMQSGLSIEQIRELISMQPRVTGFKNQVAIGENPFKNIKLPGDSRILLGIVISGTSIPNPGDTVDFTVNNNLIVQSTAAQLLSLTPGAGGMSYNKTPYIPLMQPLSGTDSLEIIYTALAAGTVDLALWYI